MKTGKARKADSAVEEGRRGGRVQQEIRQSRVLKIVLVAAVVGGLVLYGLGVFASSREAGSSPSTSDILRILTALGSAKAGSQGAKEGESLALLERRLQDLLQASKPAAPAGSSFGEKLVDCQKELAACKEGKTDVDTNMVIQQLKKQKEALETMLRGNCSDAAAMEKLLGGLKIEKELLQSHLKTALEGGDRGGGGSTGDLGKVVAALRTEKELLQTQLKIALGAPTKGDARQDNGNEPSSQKLAELTAENESLSKLVAKLERQLKQATEDANSDVSDVLKLQNRILELQAKINEMRQKPAVTTPANATEVSSLQEKVKQLEADLAKAKKATGPQNLQTKIDELEWALSEAKKAAPSCNSSTDGTPGPGSTPTDEVGQLKKKLADLEVQHERMMTENLQLTQKLADLSNSTRAGVSNHNEKALEMAEGATAKT